MATCCGISPNLQLCQLFDRLGPPDHRVTAEHVLLPVAPWVWWRLTRKLLQRRRRFAWKRPDRVEVADGGGAAHVDGRWQRGEQPVDELQVLLHEDTLVERQLEADAETVDTICGEGGGVSLLTTAMLTTAR